jgi:predicted  nucleic acid-binding Zn-ribbon protein
MNTPTPRTDAAWAQTFDANGFLFGRGNAASQMRDECATLERELAALTAERDHWQEIAKAASAEREHNANVAQAIAAERDQLRARAERAEAELAAAKERLRSEAMDDYASIKDLQRELATERARLDWLLLDNLTRFDDSISHRTAIDAAMQEGAT